MYGLPQQWLNVDNQAVQKLVGSGRLCPDHEAVLQVLVPRLNEVVRVDALQRHFLESHCPLVNTLVPDGTDVRDITELLCCPFPYESGVSVQRDRGVDDVDKIFVQFGG